MADQIINSNHMIYIVYGPGNKSSLIDQIDAVTIIPDMVEKKYKLRYHPENHRHFQNMINADYLVAYPDRLNSLASNKLKELVHGETFQVYTGNCRKRKLIIITNETPQNTIFNKDAGLKRRTCLISVEN